MSPPHRPPRPPGVKIAFSDLSELHPLILSYLKLLSPQTLLSLSKSLYNELLPVVYNRISLNQHNAQSLFHGFFPLSESYRRVGHNRNIRTLPLPGRRARSSPPDIRVSSTSISTSSHSRKSFALGLTQYLILEDAESLSLICQAHMELLSYSPISSDPNRNSSSSISNSDSNSTSDSNLMYIDTRRIDDYSYSWPLKNVHTLSVGWPLIRYLAESHTTHPKEKPLPICCIPFESKVLVIDIGRLGGVRKRFLRQAIGELASEFTLEKLELRISTVQDLKEQEEIYIPPIEHPPPAAEIRIVILKPYSKHKGEIPILSAVDSTTQYVNAIKTFLVDTGRRNFRLPKIEIVIGIHQEVEKLVRESIQGESQVGGVARSVGQRALDATTFSDIASVEL
ncbi:uncharacterized protein IL334_001427 [Kwoniella shivajii]|uniref:F-box domain-containing protein n=1 Tax=Kwoniella shivajii TaxID=564305 RepID=A0ABZ1CRY6_9TREE|nr:hypothetical protein IL334_001427 [Kwoniella shivajii]